MKKSFYYLFLVLVLCFSSTSCSQSNSNSMEKAAPCFENLKKVSDADNGKVVG